MPKTTVEYSAEDFKKLVFAAMGLPEGTIIRFEIAEVGADRMDRGGRMEVVSVSIISEGAKS